LIVDQSPEVMTLCDSKGQRTRITRADIEEVKESEVSLMPESLYKEFRPQELRDLFSFLQGDPPPTGRPRGSVAPQPLENRKEQP
ncbi:MAG TPA: hypothetical protein VFF52_30720, partial [Isosphaeraceae bacterium]|nr:hypothetical protein [Isosphaeraceae bacterium]